MIERSFDAPVHLIGQMWTNPEHLKAWYGPHGAVIPVAKMDVRVGGSRLVCMEMATPDGPMQIWFAGDYREVIEDQRLGYGRSLPRWSRLPALGPQEPHLTRTLRDDVLPTGGVETG